MDEDPAQLVGPRPAAVRGEEKRRLSADAPEFRRQSVFSSQTGFADGSKVACQSGAKRKQARAAQAELRHCRYLFIGTAVPVKVVRYRLR